MTHFPDELMDVPIPTDAEIVQCEMCRQHFDVYFETMTAVFDETALSEHKHPTDVALAYYRLHHMRGHSDR